MKLLRYGNPGQEKPGMLDQNGTIRDLSNIVEAVSYTHLTLPTTPYV